MEREHFIEDHRNEKRIIRNIGFGLICTHFARERSNFIRNGEEDHQIYFCTKKLFRRDLFVALVRGDLVSLLLNRELPLNGPPVLVHETVAETFVENRDPCRLLRLLLNGFIGL